MTRALLTGHPPLVNEIEASLSRWGVAVDICGRDVPAEDRDLAERYDVVILACGEDTDREFCELAGTLCDRGVSMLLVGGPDRACNCREKCRRRVEGVGPQAEHLRHAFEACLARSHGGDRQDDSLRDIHDYIQFLNHELRTPLTAAQTALQILSQELPHRDVESLQSVVRVALRNVERLSRTLSWSDDYFAGRARGNQPRCRRTALTELLDFSESDGEGHDRPRLEFEANAAAQSIITDPELARMVGRQVVRALRYYAPDQPLIVRVGMRPGQAALSLPDDLRCDDEVVVSYCLGGDKVPVSRHGSVIRTHLPTGAEQSCSELTRLIEFTVSREILGGLGARITIAADRGSTGPVAELILPSQVSLDWRPQDVESCAVAP